MKQPRVSAPARRDLNEIVIYFAEEAGVSVARRILAALRDAIRFIGQNPHIGHLRQDLTQEPFRFWKVQSYYVIYDSTKTPIEIVRVLHSARDIEGMI